MEGKKEEKKKHTEETRMRECILFVHDGTVCAVLTAIWLIKSVIELCDMNNL